jgi:hypothetical protein
VAADYWSFRYVIWVVPLVSLSLLAEHPWEELAEPAGSSTGVLPGFVPVLR